MGFEGLRVMLPSWIADGGSSSDDSLKPWRAQWS